MRFLSGACAGNHCDLFLNSGAPGNREQWDEAICVSCDFGEKRKQKQELNNMCDSQNWLAIFENDKIMQKHDEHAKAIENTLVPKEGETDFIAKLADIDALPAMAHVGNRNVVFMHSFKPGKENLLLKISENPKAIAGIVDRGAPA